MLLLCGSHGFTWAVFSPCWAGPDEKSKVQSHSTCIYISGGLHIHFHLGRPVSVYLFLQFHPWRRLEVSFSPHAFPHLEGHLSPYTLSSEEAQPLFTCVSIKRSADSLCIHLQLVSLYLHYQLYSLILGSLYFHFEKPFSIHLPRLVSLHHYFEGPTLSTSGTRVSLHI